MRLLSILRDQDGAGEGLRSIILLKCMTMVISGATFVEPMLGVTDVTDGRSLLPPPRSGTGKIAVFHDDGVAFDKVFARRFVVRVVLQYDEVRGAGRASGTRGL